MFVISRDLVTLLRSLQVGTTLTAGIQTIVLFMQLSKTLFIRYTLLLKRQLTSLTNQSLFYSIVIVIIRSINYVRLVVIVVMQ